MAADRARISAGLFVPYRLRLARELKGYRKAELAKIVQVSAAGLSQFETGYTKPSAAALARISVALDQPVEFFSKSSRGIHDADRDRAFFRSLRSTRQLDRDQAQARVALSAEVVDELRRYVRFPKIDIPDDLHLPEDASQSVIEQAAEELRRRWGVSSGPIPNVVRLLESKGVIVVRLSMDCETVDSFSRWVEAQPLVVLGMNEKHPDRQRFDAAHELAHLVLHQEPEAANKILESQAHMFAAAFLMPRNDILGMLPRRLDWAAFKSLKQTWGVSVSALLRRSKDLGRMSESTYRRAMMTLSSAGERMTEISFPLSTPAEHPILLSRAFEVAKQRGVSISELARQTFLRESFIREVTASEFDLKQPVDIPIAPDEIPEVISR